MGLPMVASPGLLETRADMLPDSAIYIQATLTLTE
ncbi:MAG: hypothetical protein CFH41_00140 [Alphaproteobacteria bacterium MarineAlpha11_Bin1]|mgnify:CR=1 FL=1|nr:MAG: hypothetical protein CFH41_00140 [Alphaproteobacteria bacterium MarineAlpha11_Bin1]